MLAGSRAYEVLKAQQEEAARAKKEEEALLDLLRAELEAERARRAAEERRRRQEELRAEMIQSNEVQLRLKVRGRGGRGLRPEARVLSSPCEHAFVEWQPVVRTKPQEKSKAAGMYVCAARTAAQANCQCLAPVPPQAACLRRLSVAQPSAPTRRSSGGACWSGLLRRTGWSR